MWGAGVLKRVKSFFFGSVFLLSIIALLLGPVDVLVVSRLRGGQELSLRVPFPLGQSFVAAYIHSVQKTPVEDEYQIKGNKLWQWEERFVSHNAGLPVDVPRNGVFLEQEDWMIIQGGRASFDSLAYRVGSELIGRNRLSLPGYGEWALYSLYPGERLIFRVQQEPLLWGLTRIRIPEESVCP